MLLAPLYPNTLNDGSNSVARTIRPTHTEKRAQVYSHQLAGNSKWLTLFRTQVENGQTLVLWCMALDLAKVIEAPQKQYTPHVYRYETHVVASLLVKSGSPNYVFVALLKCDTQDMVVEKVESIQREPFAIADITKTWKQNPFLPEKIQEIRQAIERPP